MPSRRWCQTEFPQTGEKPARDDHVCSSLPKPRRDWPDALTHSTERAGRGPGGTPPRRSELDRSAAPAQADAGRAAHSGRRTWERIRARLRTLGSSTPAQMDIYFTLFSLFFFTQPGNKQTKPRRLSQMPFFIFLLRINIFTHKRDLFI